MPITVRYPIDYTCSSASGCQYQSANLPIVGYQPTLMVAHLDGAGYAWTNTALLRSWDPVHFQQNIISVQLGPGETDDSYASTIIFIPSNAAYVFMLWPLEQTVTTPTHYTGYADVTYGDVDEVPPVGLGAIQQMVTILG